MKKLSIAILFLSPLLALAQNNELRTVDYWSNNMMEAHKYLEDNCQTYFKEDKESVLYQNCANSNKAILDYRGNKSCCG